MGVLPPIVGDNECTCCLSTSSATSRPSSQHSTCGACPERPIYASTVPTQNPKWQRLDTQSLDYTCWWSHQHLESTQSERSGGAKVVYSHPRYLPQHKTARVGCFAFKKGDIWLIDAGHANCCKPSCSTIGQYTNTPWVVSVEHLCTIASGFQYQRAKEIVTELKTKQSILKSWYVDHSMIVIKFICEFQGVKTAAPQINCACHFVTYILTKQPSWRTCCIWPQKCFAWHYKQWGSRVCDYSEAAWAPHSRSSFWSSQEYIMLALDGMVSAR